MLKLSALKLTYHGLHDALGHLDELLVDLDGEVAQNLPVLGQVEVLQAVFVLLARVLGHERLHNNNNNTRVESSLTYLATNLLKSLLAVK